MGAQVRLLLFAAILGLTATRPAAASTITWEWTGNVDFTYGVWATILPLGSPVSLSLMWESDTPNSPDCPPGTGRWLANQGATLTVGDWTYKSGGGGAVELNAPGGACGLAQSGLEFDLLGWSRPAGAPPLTQILVDPRMYDPFGDNLADILGYTAGDVRAFVQTPAINSGFRFNGTPVQAVPEPTTLLLITSSLGTVIVRRRRRA